MLHAICNCCYADIDVSEFEAHAGLCSDCYHELLDTSDLCDDDYNYDEHEYYRVIDNEKTN